MIYTIQRKALIFITPILLFSSFLVPLKAETESYSGYWFVGIYAPENVAIDDNYYGDIVIITDSENADGNVTILARSYHYHGTYTYYSHVPFGTTNPAGMHDYYRTGTFSGTATYTLQDVSLNDTQYQGLISSINDINTTDTNILNYLATMKNDLLQAINNLDNLIDIISWKRLYSGALNYSKTFDGNLTTSSSSISLGQNNVFIEFPMTDDTRRLSVIYHIHIPVDKGTYGNYTLSVSPYSIYNGERLNLDTKYYYKINRQSIDLYLYDFRGYFANNNRVEITLSNGTMYLYAYSNNLALYEYIDDSDIEYWSLLSFFEQHNYYQNEYPDLDTTNEELSPVVDDLVDNEDTLISDFDSSISNPNVQPSTNSSSNPSGWGTGFTSSIGFVGYVYNQLLQSAQGGNPIYMLTNFSLMLGLALLIIGKRG